MKSVKWLRKDKNQECLVWEGRGVTQEGTGAHVSGSNNLTYNLIIKKRSSALEEQSGPSVTAV